MCDCVFLVCANCCCGCLSPNATMWLIIITGILIAVGLILCFIYFFVKAIIEFIIDRRMLDALNGH